MPILLPKKPQYLLHLNNEYSCSRGGGALRPVQGKFDYGAARSLYINNINLSGSKDWCVSYWIYMLKYPFENFNFNLANHDNNNRFGLEWWFVYSGKSPLYCAPYKYTGDIYTSLNANGDLNRWTHYEFDYISANKRLLVFRNGSKIVDRTLAVHLVIQYLILGYGYDEYISELLVTQYTMHTSNFTPPTDIYLWPYTVRCYDENNEIYGRSD